MREIMEYRVVAGLCWKRRNVLWRAGFRDQNDTISEVLVHVLIHMQKYNPARSSRLTWCYNVTMCVIQTITCRRFEKGRMLDRVPYQFRRKWYTDNTIEEAEYIAYLLSLVTIPKDRVVLSLWCGGMDCTQIAKQLGVTHQRVNQRLHRAIKEIRNLSQHRSIAPAT